MYYLRKTIRILLPVCILAACGRWVIWLMSNPPDQERVIAPISLVRVEGTTLKKIRYKIRVQSQGTVHPRTKSTLLPEVAGRVIELSPSFRPGGFFEKDAILMRLDPTDYQTAITIAKAEVAQSEVAVIEEKARAQQATENWKALGRSGTPSSLVSRTPQLALAEANLAAAKARVTQAERDLERTWIKAPYQGQVLEQNVDLGQFVSQGTVLGTIFAVDYVEVRLPLPERESQFLKLPQPFRDRADDAMANVELRVSTAGRAAVWSGKIVRLESSIDQQTRQSVAVAQIIDPYGSNKGSDLPLTMGSFVQAEIEGDPIDDVYVIPRQAVRAGNEIILIERPQNTLRRVSVQPLVSNEKHIVISASSLVAPADGAVLCITPIPFPADGARVLPTIDGSNPSIEKTQRDATIRNSKSTILSQKKHF